MKPWTKKEDTLLRRYYPTEGARAARHLGRTEVAVRKRARALGLELRPRKAKSDRRAASRHHLVTPELVRWADREAGRYAARYGDPADRFGSTASAGLVAALARYEPSSGVRFDAYAKLAVRSRLEAVRAQSGVKGFARSGTSARREGAPSVYGFKEGDAEPPDCGRGPVGWEVEYADFVESLARSVPGIHGDLIRLMYLECRGASAPEAARVLGLTGPRATEIHAEAIAKIRARLTLLPREAAELLRDAS